MTGSSCHGRTVRRMCDDVLLVRLMFVRCVDDDVLDVVWLVMIGY